MNNFLPERTLDHFLASFSWTHIRLQEACSVHLGCREAQAFHVLNDYPVKDTLDSPAVYKCRELRYLDRGAN